MNFITPDFMPILPEIFVLTMACVVLIIDLYLKDENRAVIYLLTLVTLVGAAVLTLFLHTPEPVITFHGTFIKDTMSDVLKIFIYLVSGIVFLYSRDYLIERNMFKGEYFALGLFAVLGMMVLVSANNMITIYLGLELMSLALYAMVAFQRDNQKAVEAAMKYFVLGAIASGLLLYGMSIIYGMTGTLNITEIGIKVSEMPSDNIVLLFGVVFILVGLAFKLGAVPFHMWIPDVYHGAPTAVTLFIATAPKIAAFGMVMRLLVDGLGGLQAHWQEMLIALAVMSIIFGNVIAIAQTNIKRMLAYSTISHVGFLLLGIIATGANGYSSAMFYIIVYTLMGLGSFGMIILMSRAGFEADELDDLKGLAKRSPWFASMMILIMLSMAGIPPLIGFFAKLAVLQAVIDAGYVWLAVLAVLFSVVGAYYYLRVVWYMVFEEPKETAPIKASFDVQVVMRINGLGMIALGLFPASLLGMCAAAFAY